MSMNSLFLLLGGLGLFLYGMKLMSDALQLIAGFRLKKILEKLTKNKWIGAFIGFLVTAIVQSSTATTLMTVGLVNSGLMTLSGAAGIIIGSNLGSTVIGLLFTFNINAFAPFVIFLGTLLMLFIKRKQFNHIGMFFMGFGILFLGLTLMSDALSSLRDAPFMAELFHLTRNPFFGILIGFLVTAIIQSSAATMGILLTMITAGIITDLNQAIFVIYGLNIGTCTTVLLATIGTNKTAKQTATLHIIYNIFGVSIFILLGILGFNFAGIIQSLTNEVSLQLVYAHVIFNIIIIIILLPLADYLVKLSEKIIKNQGDDKTKFRFKFIDQRLQKTPSIMVEQTSLEITRMMEIVMDNFKKSLDQTERNITPIIEQEEIINYLNKEINQFLINLNTMKLDNKHVILINIDYKIIGHLERIGDLSKDTAYALNNYMNDKDISKKALKEIDKISNLINEMLDITFDLFDDKKLDQDKLNTITKLNEKVITLIEQKSTFTNLRLVKVNSNLKRISNHTLSIAKNLSKKENE